MLYEPLISVFLQLKVSQKVMVSIKYLLFSWVWNVDRLHFYAEAEVCYCITAWSFCRALNKLGFSSFEQVSQQATNVIICWYLVKYRFWCQVTKIQCQDNVNINLALNMTTWYFVGFKIQCLPNVSCQHHIDFKYWHWVTRCGNQNPVSAKSCEINIHNVKFKLWY